MKITNVLVAGIIFVVLIAAGFTYLGTVFEADTSGEGFQYRDILGGSDENGGGDLLDASAYVTSWTSGGNSEKIVLQGHFRATGLFEPAFARYWYVATLTVNNPDVKINGIAGTSWTSSTYEVPDFSTGIWYPMELAEITITNPCHGKIHVELWGHVNDLNPWSSDDGLLAVDEAYLRDGLGTVTVQNDVVEEGTNVDFYVTTGYASSERLEVPANEQGWFLLIRNPAGSVVWTKNDIADNWGGTVSWLVPVGSYRVTWDNTFQIELRNELIGQDDDWFFTVGPGMLIQIPDKPSFDLIEGETPFTKGDAITVRLSAEKTYNDIEGFTVWVSYETSAGSTTEYIYTKKFYQATQASDGTYFADVSWNFPDAGNCRLEASTIDVLKLNSGIAEMKFTIYFTETDDDEFTPFDDWLTLILGIVIMIFAFAIGIVTIWKLPMPYGFIVGMIIIIAGVATGAWILLGGLI